MVSVSHTVYVSAPKISLSVTKEASGYLGKVTCWSSQGTLPVNFSLFLDNQEAGSITATESLEASFPLPIVPGRDMGVARCHVVNEVQELISEPLNLVVGMNCSTIRSTTGTICEFLCHVWSLTSASSSPPVPVGGQVTVDVEYLYRADSKPAATRLSCWLSRGTFPHVVWFFNEDPLPSKENHNGSQPAGHSKYATADQSRTLFLTQLGPKESGYYRCRARDSYDPAGPWVESAAVLVQATGEEPHHWAANHPGGTFFQ